MFCLSLHTSFRHSLFLFPTPLMIFFLLVLGIEPRGSSVPDTYHWAISLASVFHFIIGELILLIDKRFMWMTCFPINVTSINLHGPSKVAIAEWNDSMRSEDVAHNWKKTFLPELNTFSLALSFSLLPFLYPALLQIEPRASFVLGNCSIIDPHIV